MLLNATKIHSRSAVFTMVVIVFMLRASVKAPWPKYKYVHIVYLTTVQFSCMQRLCCRRWGAGARAPPNAPRAAARAGAPPRAGAGGPPGAGQQARRPRGHGAAVWHHTATQSWGSRQVLQGSTWVIVHGSTCCSSVILLQ